MAREFVDDSTTSKRIEKHKAEALVLLEKMPNISAVCAKLGIARSTFHRWMAEDEPFRENANKATKLGKSLINDKAINNVVVGIEQKDPGMTRFWLTHNHPDFCNKPILEPWELEKLENDRKYIELSLLGRLSIGAARVFQSYFSHRNRERKVSLINKIMGK